MVECRAVDSTESHADYVRMSSWFDTSNFASLAKSALSQAQKQIDKALEMAADGEDSDGTEFEATDLGMDPFPTSGWAMRKPRMKPEDRKAARSSESRREKTVQPDSMSKSSNDIKSILVSSPKGDPSPTVTSQVRPEDQPPILKANPVTSQVKSSQQDGILAPVTSQVRPIKADEDGSTTPVVSLSLSEEKGDGLDEVIELNSETGGPHMEHSSDSVETTVQSELEYSMLDDSNKDDTLLPSSPKSSSPACNSDASSGMMRDLETATSSDIEIISAINSTPSEALNAPDHHNAFWESDALSAALRELGGGEKDTNLALEQLLHAREQKVFSLSTDNARLMEDNEKLKERVAQLETRNLESCRNSSEQVQQLLVEGEKLSKEVLEKSNIVKKLRVKEREQDDLVRKQTTAIEQFTVQVERLRKSLAQKDEQEKVHIEQIRELKAAKITAHDLKGQLDALKERCNTLEKHNAKIVLESKAMTVSAEVSAQDQLRDSVAELKEKHSAECENLQQKILQLESSLRKAETIIKQNESCGNTLRQEVLAMQEQNQELTESLAQTTAPYLRELEKLKNTCDTDRRGFENEIVTLQRNLELHRQKLANAEFRCESLEDEKVAAQAKADELEKELRETIIEMEKVIAKPVAKLVDNTEYIETLKSQLIEREDAITKMNQTIELLRSKETSLLQKISTLERNVEFERQKNSIVSTEQSFRTESPTASNRSSISSDFEKNDNFMLFSGNINSPSVVENLSAQLKLKEGMVIQLRSEIQQLKRSRDSISNQMMDISAELEKCRAINESMSDLPEKYEALLQMYGEIAEKNEELKLDLEEARNAYRVQIQDLTERLR